MSATTENDLLEPSVLSRAVEAACSRVAPSWPLDRFLAVNPFWGYIDAPMPTAAAELAASCGARMLMPRSWYLERWRRGELLREHLEAAIADRAADTTVEQLLLAMHHDAPEVDPLPLVTDLADAARRSTEPQPWSEVVVHQISQHLAAWFDRGQASWRLADEDGLFASWRRSTAADRGLPLRRERARLAASLEELPPDPQAAIEFVVVRLGLRSRHAEVYLTALLQSVRGWAAWCAHERWQARLAGGVDDQIVQLLAIRLAWEWLLVEDLALHVGIPAWRERLDHQALEVTRIGHLQRDDWLLQCAMEIAYQARMAAGLRMRPVPTKAVEATPSVQAVFCIDVRSERFRRAIEAASQGAVVTRGFAGFFGLPIDWTPIGTDAGRPQLPGLLAPEIATTEAADEPGLAANVAALRMERLGSKDRWRRFKSAATSAFTFVEACGLAFGVSLVRDALGRGGLAARADRAGLKAAEVARLRPVWSGGAHELNAARRVELAVGVLRTMGLTHGFAHLVLLAGHGSTSANNPHAHGLDCGACGGQTGEVNARLLAGLLNDPVVRRGLADRGVVVPADTWFVAGLHDTTTDDLSLFDLESLPATHVAELQRLRGWLAAAGDRTRAERAPSLGLEAVAQDREALARAVRRRAVDWAQVRPEWGLADNAAFVVAPRSRTSHLDLGGRTFLHDYDWRQDEGLATLTTILTAPMVVTNWINLQYYASTVDNRRFGSGNKVLHNVVGGTIGVFEGNGGDVRIGLAMQSLHDGSEWRHTPLRLSVFVEAPAEAIDDVIAAHEVVRQLVDNEWLFLLRIDDEGRSFRRSPGGGWRAL